MKRWFAKFRWCAALDTRKPVSPRLRRAIAKSPELQQFEQDMTALDTALRTTAVPSDPPASLHRDIMRAVRVSAPSAPAAHARPRLRWAPALAVVVVSLVTVWWAIERRASSSSPTSAPLAAASRTLDLGNDITHVMPTAAVAPLSEEFERFSRDIDRTTEFLLASLP